MTDLSRTLLEAYAPAAFLRTCKYLWISAWQLSHEYAPGKSHDAATIRLQQHVRYRCSCARIYRRDCPATMHQGPCTNTISPLFSGYLIESRLMKEHHHRCHSKHSEASFPSEAQSRPLSHYIPPLCLAEVSSVKPSCCYNDPCTSMRLSTLTHPVSHCMPLTPHCPPFES